MAASGSVGIETDAKCFSIMGSNMFYATYGKRFFDIGTAGILLLLTSPLFMLSAIALFIQNKGAVFFIQQRPGYREAPFSIIKFKTMSEACDEEGTLLPDMERMTSVGTLLRRLSLDELPQLLNVLRGDMSMIGPRPLLFKYIPLYNSEQRKRHNVKPGITGWAQVNGRNTISWEKKFELDLYYVENLSLRLDFRIVGLTIIKILKREGINQSEDRPMQPFEGNVS